MRSIPITCGLIAACAGEARPPASPPREPVSIATSQTDRRLNTLTPAPLGGGTEALDQAIAGYYERAATTRTYLQTDKPLYQPGETIWFRADLRATGTMLGGAPVGLTVQLTSPRGSVVLQKRVLAQAGVARNDLALADDLEGGEYTLTMTSDDGVTESKKLVVNTYEPPRLQKSLELLRKAYGEGDTVTAAIEVKRGTGEPFAERSITGVITVDDIELPRLTLRTDKDGKAIAKFALPAKLARGDGLLTILVDDGGVTESIQKRIPIVMKTLQLGLFPEGGDLVDGVPGRVYFAARTTLGKPADIAGKVVDDQGKTVAELSSIHDGMGRFELTPGTDRRYQVVITKPAGITQRFDVPAAKPGGCVVRSVDQHQGDVLRVAAICNTKRTLLVEAVLREQRLGGGSFEVAANEPTVVELPVDKGGALPASPGGGATAPGIVRQGVVRVTLFSKALEPLAERLVYHGAGADLRVAITADKEAYSPRDPVKLTVRTTDAAGRPIKASLGLAVVDETVLSYADDKSAHILARMFLEPELGVTAENPIEEPDYYFGNKPDAPAALDALLATRGYRRFEWRPILGGVQ